MLEQNIKFLLEAILLAAGKPMTEEQLLNLFLEEERPNLGELRTALEELQADYAERGVELVQVASGYRFQIKSEWAIWVSRLWEEKPHKYSRAFLETLALIAYRQPITRGEIEDIRGVTVSTSILKALLEDREWIRVVGHKEVPGRPALYATTKAFLDYFGLKNLQNLPALPEIMNLETVETDLISQSAEKIAQATAADDKESSTEADASFEIGDDAPELGSSLEAELEENAQS